jgi:hypothetical protein
MHGKRVTISEPKIERNAELSPRRLDLIEPDGCHLGGAYTSFGGGRLANPTANAEGPFADGAQRAEKRPWRRYLRLLARGHL